MKRLLQVCNEWVTTAAAQRIINLAMIGASALFGAIFLYGVYLLLANPIERAEAFSEPTLLLSLLLILLGAGLLAVAFFGLAHINVLPPHAPDGLSLRDADQDRVLYPGPGLAGIGRFSGHKIAVGHFSPATRLPDSGFLHS